MYAKIPKILNIQFYIKVTHDNMCRYIENSYILLVVTSVTNTSICCLCVC